MLIHYTVTNIKPSFDLTAYARGGRAIEGNVTSRGYIIPSSKAHRAHSPSYTPHAQLDPLGFSTPSMSQCSRLPPQQSAVDEQPSTDAEQPSKPYV